MATTDPQQSVPVDERSPMTALRTADAYVDSLFQQHEWLSLDRDRVHVIVCGWKRRNGVCSYNKVTSTTRVFDDRMNKATFHRVDDEHVIGVNTDIHLQGNDYDFEQVLAHELAHAEAYDRHGESQQHNEEWRRLARSLGVDNPSSKNNRRETEYEYYIGCSNCDTWWGKHRRSKKVQQPNGYICPDCRENIGSATHPDDIENGVCKVDCSDL